MSCKTEDHMLKLVDYCPKIDEANADTSKNGELKENEDSNEMRKKSLQPLHWSTNTKLHPDHYLTDYKKRHCELNGTKSPSTEILYSPMESPVDILTPLSPTKNLINMPFSGYERTCEMCDGEKFPDPKCQRNHSSHAKASAECSNASNSNNIFTKLLEKCPKILSSCKKADLSPGLRETHIGASKYPACDCDACFLPHCVQIQNFESSKTRVRIRSESDDPELKRSRNVSESRTESESIETDAEDTSDETKLPHDKLSFDDFEAAANSSLHHAFPATGVHESILRPSLFPYVPPYVYFSSHLQPGPKVPPLLHRQLKWRLSTITPIIVRKILANSGFRLVRKSNKWIGTWGKHINSSLFQTLKSYQKFNHFPGTFQIGRKDRLWRNVQKFQTKFGVREFDFIPKTYVLPGDIRALHQTFKKPGESKWILKPPASARGTGIRVVHRWSQIPKKKPLVVQHYIDNPYLINGSKFDLRLYVLITSVDPLRIYLYPDGLVRFASVQYNADVATLENRYMHLTNYSINKLSNQYTVNDDADKCQGHKWTLHTLWEYFNERDIDTKSLQQSLKDLVIKTIIAGESGITSLYRTNVRSRYNCFELFGIDVLLDANLKPWLIEVNISPSLHSNSPLDTHVKGPLVQMLLNLAQYHLPADKFTQYQRNCLIKSLRLDEFKGSGDGTDTRHNRDIPLGLDARLYTTLLSHMERLKQTHIMEFDNREDYIGEVLHTLHPADLRHLIAAEDELQVIGTFERVFPTPDTHKYLPLMEPRYFDRLFDAWESQYARKRDEGVELLRKYCESKCHLVVPESYRSPKDNDFPSEPSIFGPVKSKVTKRADETPDTSSVDDSTASKSGGSAKVKARRTVVLRPGQIAPIKFSRSYLVSQKQRGKALRAQQSI